MRSSPLRPTDEPLEAADQVMKLNEVSKETVRYVAFCAIADLSPPDERAKYDARTAGSIDQWRNLDDDAHWNRLERK